MKRSSSLLWMKCMVVSAGLLWSTLTLQGQVSFAGTQVVVAGQTLTSPAGLAADGQNNLYIADASSGQVLLIPSSKNGYGNPIMIASGLNSPHGIAADWYGNIFVAETNNNRIVMLPLNQGTYGAPVVVCAGLNAPSGVAVDSAGNVYIADTGNNRALTVSNLGSSYAAPTTVGTGLSSPVAIAVDAVKNIYIADTGNKRVIQLPLKAGVYGTPTTLIYASVITALAVDKNQNLYIADSLKHQLLELPWVAVAGHFYPPSAVGGDFTQPSAVAVDSSGRVYLADLARDRVELVQPVSANFASLAVGSVSAPQRYDFNVTAGTTLGGIAIYAHGVTGQDFVDAGDSTCVPQTYVAASLCVVDVVFNPKTSGLRTGAIVLYDGNGNALATAYLSGTGVMPKAAVFPGQTTLLGAQLSGPSGVAVDGSGNVYIADTGNDRVVELAWNGSGYANQVTIPLNAVSSPMGIAIDGAGNFYVASNGNDRVIKLPWTGSGWGKQQTVGTGLYGPTGVAVEPGGNVLIADTLDNTVWMVPWTGNAYGRELYIADYCKLPAGIAGDQFGDIFFTMPYYDILVEKPIVGGKVVPQIGIPMRGVAFPAALALDANSNLYVVDSGNNQVVMLPWTGTAFGPQVTIAKGFNAPSAIALDDSGNLYVADTGNNIIVKIDVSANSSLSFKDTNVGSTSADSPQKLILQSVGSAPLSFSDVTYPTDFPFASNSANLCLPGISLPPGSNCTLNPTFAPLIAGSPLVEQAVITDNEGNAVDNQRIISLQGNGFGKAQQSISFPLIPDTVFGAPVFPLAAVASSGLAVTYQVISGPAALAPRSAGLMITGAGPVTIQASQSGNAAFNAAPPVSISFNVSPATLTVTPVNVSAAYGSLPNSFAYTIAGFVNGQSAYQAVSGSPVITSNAAPNASIGVYTLTARQGTLSSANYSFTFTAGQLTVVPAILQFRGVSVSKTYGNVLPALTWTVSGWRNGDPPSALIGVPALSTNANSGSPVGSYPISVNLGTLQAQNYTFQFIPGTLTVLPATLLITATNQFAVYGGAIPQLTWSVTGLVQGDARGVISGTPNILTQATTGSAAGSYLITISAGTASAVNYNLQFRNGALVIQKAPLTLKAGDASVVYGQALPVFSYAITGFVNGDTQASSTLGAPSLTSSATRTSKPGTFTIAPGPGSLQAANYSFTFVNGALTISKAILTVTPRPASMIYGSSMPAIIYDSSGFVYWDNLTCIKGQAAFTTSATSSSPVGTYKLTGSVGTLTSDSYVFQIRDGTLQVQKASLAIIPATLTMTYGGALPSLTYILTGFVNGEDATVVSGQPVLTTLATSSSPAGTYSIVSLVGSLASANYNFTPGSGKLLITKGQITVTPNSASMTYGGNFPHLTYTMTGFVNGDSSAAVRGVPLLWATAPPSASVGSYSINGSTGSLTAQNYTFVIASASFTVNKAVLTISAASSAITYGQAAPRFSYVVTGFVQGETVAVIQGTASINCSYTQSSPAGVYPIVVGIGTLTASNYTFQALNGSLTVNKAQLLVTPLDTNMTYGSPVPPLTYTISGFLNGDTSAVVSGSASVTSNVLPTTSFGVYPILVNTSMLSAANYTFQKAQGKLIISKATLQVTPDAISMTYGGAIPRLTFKITGFVNGDPAGVASGGPSLSASIPDGAPVGTYLVTGTPGTLTAYNYTFVVGTGSLTIHKAILAVAPAPASMTYGGSVPPLAYTINGFVHGEGPTVISGNPVLTTDCSPLSNAGACTIFVAQGTLSAANYSFQLINGLMQVRKATLLVTAADASVTYGGKLPSLQYQVTGFLNGDNASVITGQPAITSKGSSTSAAGTYAIVLDISAMSASNYSFMAVTGKLTITKAPLIVTPANATRTYGGPWPKLSYEISGFVNGDTAAVVSGYASLSTNANGGSAVGTYSWNAIPGSLVAVNYTFLGGSGTLTITPATLTVVALNAAMTYGTSPPALRFGLAGLVNGDFDAAVSGAPTETTTATSSSPVGNYPITIGAGTLSAANYTFAFANGTMTVNKAVLNILPGNPSMTYGASVPTLIFTLRGFVNGDTQASATTGTPQLTTSASATSPVGHYDIVSAAGTLTAANYSFAPQKGTLSVTPAPLTLTANNLSMKVGAKVPALTFTPSGFVNGNTIASSTTGSPTLTTSATSSSKAGTYPITITQGSMASVNYLPAFVNGTLTIIK